jgi:ribonuclease HI
MSKILAYTDGSSINNPGPSGIGLFLIKEKSGKTLTKEYSKGFKHATNNQMELLACLYPFKLSKDKTCVIEVLTDSQYAINCVTVWAKGWAKNNWRKPEGGTYKNLELIKPLYELYKSGRLIMTKVKGHSGIEGNDKADLLARTASATKTGQVDYEKFVQNLISALST